MITKINIHQVSKLDEVLQCLSPENTHTPPHRKDLNSLKGGGFCKAKHLKEMYEA